MSVTSLDDGTPAAKRIRIAGNEDTIPRCGYDPLTKDLLIELLTDTATSHDNKNWCILFNLSFREWRVWRRAIRVHLRKNSGIEATEDLYRTVRGFPDVFCKAGKTMEWWMCSASKLTEIYILSSNLMSEIMGEVALQSFFTQTPTSAPTASTAPLPTPASTALAAPAAPKNVANYTVPDKGVDGEDVDRVIPGYMVKLKLLQAWIFWESMQMQKDPNLRDLFTEDDTQVQVPINPKYYPVQMTPSQKKKGSKYVAVKNQSLIIIPMASEADKATWIKIPVMDILSQSGSKKPRAKDIELDDVSFTSFRRTVAAGLGEGTIAFKEDGDIMGQVTSQMAMKEALQIMLERQQTTTEKQFVFYFTMNA